jgi:hypothetical protein
MNPADDPLHQLFQQQREREQQQAPAMSIPQKAELRPQIRWSRVIPLLIGICSLGLWIYPSAQPALTTIAQSTPNQLQTLPPLLAEPSGELLAQTLTSAETLPYPQIQTDFLLPKPIQIQIL